MKRLIILLFILSGAYASALSPGITFGTWNPGSSLYLGGTVGVSERFEAELFSVLPMMPEPFSGISAGAAVTGALFSPRELHSGEGTLFFNSYLSAGYLHGTDDRGVFLRVTPLATGGPYYGIRERAANLGFFYSFESESMSVFWNIFLIDFY